jgi:hypothetical protein
MNNLRAFIRFTIVRVFAVMRVKLFLQGRAADMFFTLFNRSSDTPWRSGLLLVSAIYGMISQLGF